jgi:endonuclease-3
MSDARLTAITDALLEYGKTIPPEVLFPTVSPDAAEIVTHNPYAFCIATCLDRGTKAEIIWTIPFDIRNDLGHLDPFKINQMSLDDLADLFVRLPRRPRYVNDAPRTVKELTRIVIRECDGDASLIWIGKKAIQVQRTFDSVHGVGRGIASMAALLIEKAFSIQFEDPENMDIKPDVHTKRVLYRLEASVAETEEAALEATRRMNPAFPGKVDGALWEIGRRWCRPTNPDCKNCPVKTVCMKRII